MFIKNITKLYNALYAAIQEGAKTYQTYFSDSRDSDGAKKNEPSEESNPDLRPYTNNWVAVRGRRIVGSGFNLEKALKEAETNGVRDPLVFFVSPDLQDNKDIFHIDAVNYSY